MNYWERAKREKEGVAHVVPSFPEWTFYVRRCSDWAPDFQRAIARIQAQPDYVERLKRRAEPGYVQTDEDDKAQERDIMAAFGEGCIARWEGVTDGDGVPLAFTKGNALHVLETFPEIYSALMIFARTPKNFEPLGDAIKDTLASGNLSPASNSLAVRGGNTSAFSRSATRGAQKRQA